MLSFTIITIKNVKNYVSTNHIVVKNTMNEQINPGNVIAALIDALHSQLFDFEATNVGAEWIDDYVSRAEQVLLHATGTEGIVNFFTKSALEHVYPVNLGTNPT